MMGECTMYDTICERFKTVLHFNIGNNSKNAINQHFIEKQIQRMSNIDTRMNYNN